MGDRGQFLTVTAQNGTRMAVNLDQVFEIAEAEGGCAFMFVNGSVLVARDDFESIALAIGHEVTVPRVPTGAYLENARVVSAEVTVKQPHPWRTYGAVR